MLVLVGGFPDATGESLENEFEQRLEHFETEAGVGRFGLIAQSNVSIVAWL